MHAFCFCLFVPYIGAVLGEDHSKSPGLSEWGEDTSITITIPLDVIQPICDWPNTNENKMRQKFCSQYEGYKELCDCKSCYKTYM